jgi:1-acyl-sn-glycerol-3-phosphate acyltransferase
MLFFWQEGQFIPHKEEDMQVPAVKDSYVSPEARPGFVAARFPTLCFYVRDLAQIARAFFLIKKRSFTPEQFMNCSYGIVHALESVGCRVVVENVSALARAGGPCVIVANHMSTLETFVLPWMVLQHTPMTFVIKKSLLKIPFFGAVTAGWDPIAVGRENPRQDLKHVLEQGQQRIASGASVIVFPQSTRMVRFDPSRFNTIGVKLARRAKVPVVPLALKTDAWSNGTWVKDFGPIDPKKEIRFCFGEPMAITGNGKEQHERCVAFVREKLEQWG